MEYFLICSLDRTVFTKYVNEWLGEGWQLYGSPFVVQDGQYCQAMTREEDHSDDNRVYPPDDPIWRKN